MKLTTKQDIFCQEYLIDLNGTQAAIRAGYSEKTANEQSSQLLAKLNIRARIEELQKARAEKLEIDATWVLQRLKSISDRCMQAEPVMIWSPADKSMVHAKDADDNNIYQFDSSGANKATEMIGKHIGFFEIDNKQQGIKVIIKKK
jgi:phage terminase small subunit